MKFEWLFRLRRRRAVSGHDGWPSTRKLFCIMNITGIILLAVSLQVSAAVYSQHVTLKAHDSTLESIFNQIREQTGYNFLYKSENLQHAKKITFNTSGDLQKILKELLTRYQLTFSIINNTILIKKINEINARENKLPTSKTLIDVKGKVTDEKGESLPGVSIKIKGTSRVIVSDINGLFNLPNADEDAILVVSYVGFAEQEIPVGGRNDINIVLKENIQVLSDVVVVGYGTQKKINLTGSISSIKAEDLTNRPAKNLSNLLQGQMPGVTVRSSTGLPGQASSSIRIRGIGTLGDASPLYIVDGVPTRSIDILNPDDIESISVLKDASSASIYGVRGANGVILITTKKGTKGGTTLAYSNYFGLQTPTALPEFVGSVDYMSLLNEAQSNVGQSPTYSPEDIEVARNGSNPNYFSNTNWVNELLKNNAPQQAHNLSLSGQASDINFYASYGYLNEGGLITGDNYSADRNNARLRLNTKLFDRLDIDANLGYSDRKYSGAAEGIGNGDGALYVLHAITPLTPVRFTNGSWGLGSARNPIATNTDGGTNKYSSQELNTNLLASYKIMEGLSLRGQYALNKYNSRRSLFTRDVRYYSPEDGSLLRNNPNSLTVSSYSGSYYTIMGLVEYNRTFKGKHDIKFLAGVSEEQNKTDDFSASRTDFPVEEVPSINLGSQNQLNSGGGSISALRSAFGRINYAFKGKYLAELNFRYDGSTQFAKDLRWQLFTSGSAGWVFSEEKFFDQLRPIFETAKLRFSYGSLGNDKVGSSFAYMSTLQSVTAMPIGNTVTVGFRESGSRNNLLTWESAIQRNIGLDIGMLKGRLNLTAEYYKNQTNDILLTVALPDVLGTSYPPQNAGKVENKGWELQISWKDKKGDFRYGAGFNLADVKNKVVSLGDAPATLGDQIRMVGYPIDAFYGLQAKGIAQLSDFTYDEATQKYTANFPYINGDPVAPGDIMYEDLDGDGLITLAADRKVLGNPIPRYTYGFNGEVAWKALDFSFLIQGVGKADGYLRGAARHAFTNIGNDPIPQKVHLDRWTPENPAASYPRLTAGQSHNQRLSSFWLENASYLRLKNIQIGYTIPERISNKFRANRFRIYASAENLFTETSFFYSYDPEIPVNAGGFYPQVKTVVLGLNINFK